MTSKKVTNTGRSSRKPVIEPKKSHTKKEPSNCKINGSTKRKNLSPAPKESSTSKRAKGMVSEKGIKVSLTGKTSAPKGIQPTKKVAPKESLKKEAFKKVTLKKVASNGKAVQTKSTSKPIAVKSSKSLSMTKKAVPKMNKPSPPEVYTSRSTRGSGPIYLVPIVIPTKKTVQSSKARGVTQKLAGKTVQPSSVRPATDQKTKNVRSTSSKTPTPPKVALTSSKDKESSKKKKEPPAKILSKTTPKKPSTTTTLPFNSKKKTLEVLKKNKNIVSKKKVSFKEKPSVRRMIVESESESESESEEEEDEEEEPREKSTRVASLNAKCKVAFIYESQVGSTPNGISSNQTPPAPENGSNKKELPPIKPSSTNKKVEASSSGKKDSKPVSITKALPKKVPMESVKSDPKKSTKSGDSDETESEDSDNDKDSDDDSSDGNNKMPPKGKGSISKDKKGFSKIVPKKQSSKKVKKKKKMTPKRRNSDVDPEVEIIDTRVSKRVASLNASAIMAASYLPDSKALLKVEPRVISAVTENMTNGTVIEFSSSVSHVEGGASVMVSEKKVVVSGDQNTIEMVKSRRMEVRKEAGTKMRDRLMAIEMMDKDADETMNDHESEGIRIIPRGNKKRPPKEDSVTTTKVVTTKVQSTLGDRQVQTKILKKKDIVNGNHVTTESYSVSVQNEGHPQASFFAAPATNIQTPSLMSLHQNGPHMTPTLIPTNYLSHVPQQATLSNHINPYQTQNQGQQSTQRAMVQFKPANHVSYLQVAPFPIQQFAPQYVQPYPTHSYTTPYHPLPPQQASNVTVGYYQPAGPMISPQIDTTGYVHKPIPYNPSAYAAPHPSAQYTIPGHINGGFSSFGPTFRTGPQPAAGVSSYCTNTGPSGHHAPGQVNDGTPTYVSFNGPLGSSSAGQFFPGSFQFQPNPMGTTFQSSQPTSHYVASEQTPMMNQATFYPVQPEISGYDEQIVEPPQGIQEQPVIQTVSSSPILIITSRPVSPSPVASMVSNVATSGVSSLPNSFLSTGRTKNSNKQQPVFVDLTSDSIDFHQSGSKIPSVATVRPQVPKEKNKKKHQEPRSVVQQQSVPQPFPPVASTSIVQPSGTEQPVTINSISSSSVSTQMESVAAPTSAPPPVSAPKISPQTRLIIATAAVPSPATQALTITPILPESSSSSVTGTRSPRTKTPQRSPRTAVESKISPKIVSLSSPVLSSSVSSTSSSGVNSTPTPSPSTSATPSNNQVSPAGNKKIAKKKFSHGWSWVGKGKPSLVYATPESVQPVIRNVYQTMKHVEGAIIRKGDNVLLLSGPDKHDLPFVAKISALWETVEGDMMMSLFWYYRPEHTEAGRIPHKHMPDELFASRHRDVNSVACIEDKCFVLYYNEYVRFRAKQQLFKSHGRTQTLIDRNVPKAPGSGKRELPPINLNPDLLFCCRNIYDSRTKRIIKNY